MPTLAQAGFDAPAPPDLPGPPLFSHVFFEAPLLPAAALVLLGIVLYVVLNSRAKPGKGFVLGATCLALAGGLFLTANMVRTPRERVLAQSKRLVDAVAGADTGELGPLLADDCHLEPTRISPSLDKPGILAATRQFADAGANAIKEHAIVEAQASLDGPNVARAQLKVRVTPQATGAPMLSWWRIDFRKDGDGAWRAARITPLSMTGMGELSP